jgi:hypothetical protein
MAEGRPSSPMEKPPRIPLVVDPENRYNTTDKDAKITNAFMEPTDKIERQYHIYKRPGYGSQQIVNNNAVGMGLYTWNGNVYSIFGGILYKNGASVATGLDTTAGVYQFSEIKGASPKMVLNNGAMGYAYDDTAGLSANLHSLSPSYPQYSVKGWAYLNGAQYVMQHFFGTQVTPAVIWGSAIDDVTSAGAWDPLDFLTAQIEPDAGVCMAKQYAYVVALNQWSTEIFYDAGNPTGSPLAPVPGSKLRYGCASADSVQSIEDVLFWVSTNRSASNQIVMMLNLQATVISTPAIDRLLNDADMSALYSWQLKLNGHTFYILTIINSNVTIVYDILSGLWSYWSDINGNYIPVCASTYDSVGHKVIQHATNGSLYYIDSSYGDDNGISIDVEIITPAFDGGTRRWKHLGMMEIVGDKQVGNWFTVQVSDDDYNTWSQPRQVSMGMERMLLPNCGRFRRRAWKIIYGNFGPFRISSVELQFDIGTL